MLKRRNVIVVEVDLDGVPGWNYTPDDMVALIQHELNRAVPHNKPVVTYDGVYTYDPMGPNTEYKV